MILTVEQIAKVTNGVWKNLPKNFFYHDINFASIDIKEHDLVVVRSRSQFLELTKGNEDKIPEIIKKNPAALIVRNSIPIPNYPCLIVENTKEALKSIALATRELSEAKRVLVTGSYGKTGFKIRLNHLIKNEIKTKIIANSANEDSGVYKALASLSEEDKVTIVEVGGSKLNRALRRSEIVRPHICVITSIGHEDIHLHKTLDNTVYNKASVVRHLNENGIAIIKYDKYYDKMCKAILEHNPKTIIKSVGNISSQAYIVNKYFVDFTWNIEAYIDGEIIKYTIPFMDDHAPEASLLEFLTAKYLGVDVKKIASRYEHIENFESSGKLYTVEINQKRFILYDQSHRGGIESYESFFRTIEYIKPKRAGRKILFTSAFVDHEDNDMDNINPNSFQKLIQKSDFDAIFTTEYFAEHVDVLADTNIWKKHSFDYRNIRDNVLDYIGSDDIVFVKGIFGSKLRYFLPYIKGFSNSKVLNYKKEDNYLEIGRKLDIQDIARYKEKLQKSETLAWCYYFPFLFFFAKSKDKELLIEEIDESIVIYFLRNSNAKKPILELFCPPFPMNEEVLQKAQEKIYKYRGKNISNILWVDEKDKELVSKYFNIISREEEYIFSYANTQSLIGSKFKNLRYNLKSFNANKNIELRDYSIDDYFSCLPLLKEWNTKQRDKYESIDDFEYTKNCLRLSHKFAKKDLFGKVVLVDNIIKAFAFAGEMYENIGNLFIVKTDPNIKGISYYIKLEILKSLQHCTYVNDSSDLGYKGLGHAKRSFDPVFMHKIYKARDGF